MYLQKHTLPLRENSARGRRMGCVLFLSFSLSLCLFLFLSRVPTRFHVSLSTATICASFPRISSRSITNPRCESEVRIANEIAEQLPLRIALLRSFARCCLHLYSPTRRNIKRGVVIHSRALLGWGISPRTDKERMAELMLQ